MELLRALQARTLGPKPKGMPRPNLSNARACKLAPYGEDAFLLEQTLLGYHWHKCGFATEPRDPDEAKGGGCGFEWAHENSDRTLVNEKIKPSHDCPKCGKGPWLSKYYRGRPTHE